MLVTWVKTELFNSQSQFASFKRVYGIVTGLFLCALLYSFRSQQYLLAFTHTHTSNLMP